MRRVFVILFLIFLPIYILLKGTEISTYNKSFYIKSYEKYQVPEVSSKSLEELDIITEDLFSYLKDKAGEEILSPYFNEKEIKHMEDVKILFKKGHRLKSISFVLSIVLLIVFIQYKEWKVAREIFYGIFMWWGLMVLLFLLTLVDFNKYFTYFHLIFFDNDLWLLDPNTDLLIQMLPEEFFISIFRRIVLLFFSSLAIIQILSYIVMKKGEKNNGPYNRF